MIVKCYGESETEVSEDKWPGIYEFFKISVVQLNHFLMKTKLMKNGVY